MDYAVDIEGFEGRDIVVRSTGLLPSFTLLIDGQVVPAEDRSGKMLARRRDGRLARFRFRSPNPLDPVPQLIVDGKLVQVAESFRWYQWAWMGLPLILVLLGGLIGAICGALGFIANVRVFRTHLLAFNKYVVAAGVTIGVTFLYELLFTLTCLAFPGLAACSMGS